MNNFWQKLPKPFTVLAPMDGVTDVVFRQMMVSIGRPDVFFTEFTSTSGLMSKGFEKVVRSLKFKKNELPVVAQIWGLNPKDFYDTAKLCKKMGFSGIDLNMGCPIYGVVKKGACSALIKNKPLAKEIIQATKEGAQGLPVSVKTRLGFENEQINDWISFLLEQDLPALIIHLRTVAELSKVDAHWELMPKIIKLKNKIAPDTKIVGNGDIKTKEEIGQKFEKYGCDGFMIGRGVFFDPWIFNNTFDYRNETAVMRLNLYLEHIKLFEKIWKDEKNPDSLKKFSKMYINNFNVATEFRNKINLTKTTQEMIELINLYVKNLS